jgi:hypothetical protein
MKILFISIYLLCIALLALREFRNREYNWDMIPYMGVILSYDSSDTKYLHDTIYNIIEKQVPANDYKLLVNGGIGARLHSAENADFFSKQLPFYTVKPFYTGFVYFLYKTGVPLEKATVLPSIISYFLIGLLIGYWLKKYLHLYLALPVSLLIMLCRPMLATAGISTPDCLSALILLIAFYFLIEKKSLVGICVFLMLSIFTRLDNIIPAMFIISLLTFTPKWKEKLSLTTFSIVASIMACCYFIVSLNARKYGWSIFYYPSFISHLNPDHDTQLPFSLSNYFSVAESQIKSGLFFSDLVLFLLLGFLLFIDQRLVRLKELNFDQLLFVVFILMIFSRFILQPLIADRVYIAYYIGILVLLIRQLRTRLKPF